jgi:phosphocarrier protein HPr
MIIRQVRVMNKAGLHARPAVKFVDLASKFKSEIFLEKADNRFNGKSIVSVLSAGIAHGDKINLIIEGEDEEIADRVLVSLLKTE